MKSLRAKTNCMPWQYFIPCYYNGSKLCQKKISEKFCKRSDLEKHLTIKNCDSTFLKNILRFKKGKKMI